MRANPNTALAGSFGTALTLLAAPALHDHDG
jgi:hypothetical protein